MKLDIHYSFSDRYHYFLHYLHQPLTLILRYFLIASGTFIQGSNVYLFDIFTALFVGLIPHLFGLILTIINYLIRLRQHDSSLRIDVNQESLIIYYKYFSITYSWSAFKTYYQDKFGFYLTPPRTFTSIFIPASQLKDSQLLNLHQVLEAQVSHRQNLKTINIIFYILSILTILSKFIKFTWMQSP